MEPFQQHVKGYWLFVPVHLFIPRNHCFILFAFNIKYESWSPYYTQLTEDDLVLQYFGFIKSSEHPVRPKPILNIAVN